MSVPFVCTVDKQADRHGTHTLGHCHTEGTNSQTYRGTLDHCQLYIQRTQTTTERGGTQWGTLGLSTVHSEGTDNQTDGTHWGTVNCTLRGQTTTQTDKGHTWWGTLGHWSTVNCTYRGHRQPDRQGAHIVGHTGALSTVHTEGTDNH